MGRVLMELWWMQRPGGAESPMAEERAGPHGAAATAARAVHTRVTGSTRVSAEVHQLLTPNPAHATRL